MNFLNESGLKNLWAKIKASFGTAVVSNSKYNDKRDDSGAVMIPFVANHQIINVDIPTDIDVFNWFKGASEGGILEIIPTSATISKKLYCINDENTSIIYKMAYQNGFLLRIQEALTLAPANYLRLIKLDEKLIVAAQVFNNKMS